MRPQLEELKEQEARRAASCASTLQAFSAEAATQVVPPSPLASPLPSLYMNLCCAPPLASPLPPLHAHLCCAPLLASPLPNPSPSPSSPLV